MGCEIPENDKKIVNPEVVITYGFLNQNDVDGMKLLNKLYRLADFFLLPTKAECAGIVYGEASAYSVPIITYDTGGVGDYVINGKNGYRLPPTATAEDFAKKILSIVQNPLEWDSLQKNTRNIYEEDLNWSVFGKKLWNVIESL